MNDTNLQLSKLGLGTAQIGIPGYGLGKSGLPSDAEAEHLLRSAVELGVTFFDTARAYGVAEERLGKFGIPQLPGVTIGTKCGQFLRDNPDMPKRELMQKLREELDLSRKLLRIDTLSLVQLHIELPDFKPIAQLIEIMREFQHEKLVEHVGISSRGEELPLAAITSGFFGLIQVAHSILDQRMCARVLPAALKDEVKVINRSVLLKGSLSSASQELPAALAPLRQNALRAASIARECSMELPALAIRFAVSEPAVSCILIGTRSLESLKSAAAAVAAGPLEASIVEELRHLAINDPEQVDPARWPK